jgi:hypothetical protein
MFTIVFAELTREIGKAGIGEIPAHFRLKCQDQAIL